MKKPGVEKSHLLIKKKYLSLIVDISDLIGLYMKRGFSIDTLNAVHDLIRAQFKCFNEFIK